jgi:hypothetical protein
MTTKRNRKAKQNDEQPADLSFWLRDGGVAYYRARVPADTEVSIGRTNSKRALGFIVTRGKVSIDFVLNKDQVAELAAYCRVSLPGLLKPTGRKPDQISLVASIRMFHDDQNLSSVREGRRPAAATSIGRRPRARRLTGPSWPS